MPKIKIAPIAAIKKQIKESIKSTPTKRQLKNKVAKPKVK